jgi:F-type H+-transporting ATPase subunit gamma
VARIVLVYTRFVSLLSHRPTALSLLPLEDAPESGGPSVATEPDAEALIRELLPDYLAGCIFGALAESALCEQSARMTSMDAAVRNCDELIGQLRLRYNQARQDAITLELNEIVGGAEALAARR